LRSGHRMWNMNGKVDTGTTFPVIIISSMFYSNISLPAIDIT